MIDKFSSTGDLDHIEKKKIIDKIDEKLLNLSLDHTVID
jgi:hypothetical protein